jgi:hypothetical protein
MLNVIIHSTSLKKQTNESFELNAIFVFFLRSFHFMHHHVDEIKKKYIYI